MVARRPARLRRQAIPARAPERTEREGPARAHAARADRGRVRGDGAPEQVHRLPARDRRAEDLGVPQFGSPQAPPPLADGARPAVRAPGGAGFLTAIRAYPG